MLDSTPFDIRVQAGGSSQVPKAPLSAETTSRSPTNDDGKVGRRVRDIRRRLGLTLKEVAARVGVTGAQMHRYEVGSTRIAASRLVSIASALGVAPEFLIGDRAAPAAAAHATRPPRADDLVELVDLFSALADDRRRAAVLTFARSLAKRTEPDAEG